MKVWCFNCYGVCIARLAVERIANWNEKHVLASEKVVSWKE